MDDQVKKSALSWKAIAVLGISAVVFDLITLIPLAGDFVGPIFWLSVSYFIWKKGFGLLKPRRLITEAISLAAELFPAVQALPTITVGTVIIIIMLRFEEKTGIKLSSTLNKGKPPVLNSGGIRKPQIQTPSNVGGVRPPNGGLTTS